jgi:hypothetical protein
MAELRIISGLRKMEFSGGDPEGREGRAQVEFARPSRLPPGSPVHISLGMREGKLRALVGVPQLIKEPAAGGGGEYLYRLFGPITEESA